MGQKRLQHYEYALLVTLIIQSGVVSCTAHKLKLDFVENTIKQLKEDGLIDYNKINKKLVDNSIGLYVIQLEGFKYRKFRATILTDCVLLS